MQDRSDNTHTTDGVEITPGLWVWDNNLDSRQVSPGNWPAEDAEPRSGQVGSPHFDGWYDTLDAEGKRAGLSNGTRMITVFRGALGEDPPLRAEDYQGMRWADAKAAAAGHEISIDGPLDYPGGKDGMYRSRCSCGYLSGFDTKAQVEKSAAQHVAAARPIKREPVTLHVIMFIQGHHSDHSTEFVLTTEDGDPRQSTDVLSRITYPVRGVQRDFVNEVAKEMDVDLIGPLHEHSPRGWHDHVSYRGLRKITD